MSDEMTRAQRLEQLQLVKAAQSLGGTRTERHACYPVRRNHDEAAVVLELYPSSRRDGVSNVVPLRPRPEPPRPAA